MVRQSKFNVGKDKSNRTYGDIVFDSAMEMKYFSDVIVPGVASGDIKSYERQKKYVLQPSYMRDGKKILPIEYKADFYVVYSDDREEVIDIKGCPDAVAILKRKLFEYVFPGIKYVWISFSKIDGGWITYEDVKAARKKRRKQKEMLKEKKG